MEIICIAEKELKVTPRGIKARSLVDLPDVNVMNLVLAPSEKVPVHTTSVDVLFHIIGGQGTVTIGSDTAQVNDGEIVVSPAGIPHALEASGDSVFNVLVIKTPNPKSR